MNPSLTATVCNPDWLLKHESEVRALLPDTWTHVENVNGMQLGFGFKLLGIDWRSEDEFGQVMVYLEKIGMLQRRNEYQVRANHLTIFK